MLEPQAVSNFGYGQLCCRKHFLCFFDQFVMNELLGALPGKYFE